MKGTNSPLKTRTSLREDRQHLYSSGTSKGMRFSAGKEEESDITRQAWAVGVVG